MDSDGKYKTHLIRNLTNKQTKYMPSISSISDLSLDGKNKRWSRRWNGGVQSGAENLDEYDDYDYSSESVSVKTDDSTKSERGDTESSDYSLTQVEPVTSDNGIDSTEFEKYKLKIKNRYKNLYQKKYRKLKKLLKKLEPSNTGDHPDSNTTSALTGLAFWPSFNETLKNGINKQNPKDGAPSESLIKQISDNCYKNDTKSLCTRCKYNHIKDCEDICGGNQKHNGLDITITRSNTGKVIDTLRVNLDPKSLNKSLLNSINICVKSNRCGRMDAYKTTNRCIESDLVASPKIKVEPTFGYNYSKSPSYSVPVKTHHDFTMKNTNSIKSEFKNSKNGYIVYNRKSAPRGSLEVKVDGTHGCANENMCNANANNFNKEHSSVDCNYSYKSPNYGENCRKYVESYRFPSSAETINEAEEPTNDPNVTESDNYGDDANEPVVNGGSSVYKNAAENFDLIPEYGSANDDCNPSLAADYYKDSLYECDDVVNLIRQHGRLHGFKINNRGVNVPLFLNIGASDSVYSGQAFVSNTTVGLFRISVVEPIEPVVNLASKIVSLVGLNNYRGSSCKCRNITPALAIKKALPATEKAVNNIFDSLEGYKRMPWINPLKSYVSQQIANASKSIEARTAEVNVCDFHKNLFAHRVDRTRFGKDLFCQLKYISAIGAHMPLSVEKNSFTAGSNVSSFFNGFHEQMLCISGTSGLSQLDLRNNHKFTFIIRRVKGSRYGRNFAIVNTTSGQHLCLDILTHELRFEEECKFSKYLVPAIFKIIPLVDIAEAISQGSFDCFRANVSRCSEPSEPSFAGYKPCVDRLGHYQTCLSTTDQYINVVD